MAAYLIYFHIPIFLFCRFILGTILRTFCTQYFVIKPPIYTLGLEQNQQTKTKIVEKGYLERCSGWLLTMYHTKNFKWKI